MQTQTLRLHFRVRQVGEAPAFNPARPLARSKVRNIPHLHPVLAGPHERRSRIPCGRRSYHLCPVTVANPCAAIAGVWQGQNGTT